MLTLTQASKETKQLILWGGLFLGAIVALILFFRLAIFVKELIFPTPPPKPLVAYGKLQPQIFPKNVTDQNLTYTINTLSGGFPAFPDQARVYRIQPIQPDLLAISKFQQKAISIGFSPGQTTISDKIYEWKSNPNLSGGLDKRIRTNVVENSFTITSPYQLDGDILGGKNLPDENTAIGMAQNMLGNMELLSEDIDESKTKANLFFIKNGVLSNATSLSNTQIIEVNFFQKNVDKLPIFYERPFSSNISILVAGGKDRSQIVGANYIHQKISDQSTTYPIKTAGQAFTELKEGKAYIASYFGDLGNINITNVVLGYYMSSQTQDFLMPVYVFEGDDGFRAYVGAITDELINK